jgi:hypothetical protein
MKVIVMTDQSGLAVHFTRTYVATFDRILREMANEWQFIAQPYALGAVKPPAFMAGTYTTTMQALQTAAGAVPKASPPPATVRVGQRVSWFTGKFGGQLTGTVRTAYAGCRARVRADDGREFYVPQRLLSVA